MKQTKSKSKSESNWLMDREFGIVIDAGSSGTRLQVYSWKTFQNQIKNRLHQSKSIHSLPHIQTGVEFGDDWQLKIEPGISSFRNYPHRLGQYLKPLLDHSLKLIPRERIHSTSLYLLATAGMRLLTKVQQDHILNEICNYIKSNYRFKINDCDDQIRTISGEEEGLFGWISVNYLMDGFNLIQQHDKNKKQSSFGFLDMGGASTQIAFEPNSIQRSQHSDNLTNITLKLLDGTLLNYSVFVTTWLGFGTNKARERYSKKLIDHHHQINSNVILDPCLPNNLTLPYPSSSSSSSSNYQFNGTGDFKQCIQNISPLLNKNVPCLDEPCLFDGKHVPLIDFSINRFIGISEYWYSTQDLWSMGGIYNFVKFEKKAIDYCNQTWNEIIQDFKNSKKITVAQKGLEWPNENELSRLETQCFKAAWIINVLHDGIGLPRFNDNQINKLIHHQPKFQSLNQVGNMTLSWTLGQIVLELSKNKNSSSLRNGNSLIINSKINKFITSKNYWFQSISIFSLLLSSLIIFIIFLSIKMIIYYYKFKKESHVSQGYILTSMEEGDCSRRDNSSNPSRRSFRKPSLSTSRDFLIRKPTGWINKTISTMIKTKKKVSSTTSSPIEIQTSHSNSPRLSRINSFKLNDNDTIPPVFSITTSLSTTPTPPPFTGNLYHPSSLSFDDGLFSSSLPLSRSNSNNSSLHLNFKRFH